MLISEFARKTASQPIRCASGRPQQDIVSAFSVPYSAKLRRFWSALRALINYLVPAAAPSRFNRLDRQRARCLAFRTVYQRVEAGRVRLTNLRG
jgi:hypothetical protein